MSGTAERGAKGALQESERERERERETERERERDREAKAPWQLCVHLSSSADIKLLGKVIPPLEHNSGVDSRSRKQHQPQRVFRVVQLWKWKLQSTEF